MSHPQQFSKKVKKMFEYKLYISRVPTSFSEDVVKRILEKKLGSTDCISDVTLIYPKEGNTGNDNERKQDDGENSNTEYSLCHRGFGFVTLTSSQWLATALDLKTIRGGLRPNSTRKHTMYLRPYHSSKGKGAQKSDNDDESVSNLDVCYLWTQNRCPYGNQCKFKHTGIGSCIVVPDTSDVRPKKSKQKCFAYKKGKCKRGIDCPFSHDFLPTKKVDRQPIQSTVSPKKPDSEKDCINWKTNGKCRKGDQCPYRHDLSMQKLALEKREKRKRENTVCPDDIEQKARSNKKAKQPLSVRVFGLNYETKEQNVRDFFKSCGPIVEVTFPVFEDSGRSKGYCGILFQSPKAVEKAVELDGQELFGRWLRIQAGKMYLKQWEEQELIGKKRA